MTRKAPELIRGGRRQEADGRREEGKKGRREEGKKGRREEGKKGRREEGAEITIGGECNHPPPKIC
jgi:hypothetical protein